MLFRESNHPGPIATHPIFEKGQQSDFCVVDRTRFVQHVEYSPHSWSKFAKSTCSAQNAVFEVDHAKIPFHHRLLPTKSINIVHGWTVVGCFHGKCPEMTRTRYFPSSKSAQNRHAPQNVGFLGRSSVITLPPRSITHSLFQHGPGVD